VEPWADVAAARAFYHSQQYQEARSHRLGAPEFNMTIVEGA